MSLTQDFWISRSSKSRILYTIGETMTLPKCLDLAYSYIMSRNTEDNINSASLSVVQWRERTKELIISFVEEKQPMVEGFVEDHKCEMNRLTNKLIEEILEWKILTEPMENPNVNEIQANDYKSIYIDGPEYSGLLKNRLTGEVLTFASPAEMTSIANKLLRLSNVSLSQHGALQGGITMEGYRVAAIDGSVAARNKGESVIADRSPSFVIRKFPKDHRDLNDLIAYQSLSTQMAFFLRTLVKTREVRMVVSGGTGSGKTTLLQSIVSLRNPTLRTISVEDNSELDLHIRDENGVDLTNTLQLEARPDPQGKVSHSYPTFENIILQLLRMTPDVIVLGEMRADEIVNLAVTAANTGHGIYSTIHADSVDDCIVRMARSVAACMPSVPYSAVLEIVCSAITLMVYQKRLEDGSRKVMEISEICGVRHEGGIALPVVNKIFVFEPTSKGVDKDTGKVQGEFRQVGKLSKRFAKRLASSALSTWEYEFVTAGPNQNEYIVGTYESIPLGD